MEVLSEADRDEKPPALVLSWQPSIVIQGDSWIGTYDQWFPAAWLRDLIQHNKLWHFRPSMAFVLNNTLVGNIPITD